MRRTAPCPLTSEFKKTFLSHNFTLQLKNQGTDPLKLNLQVTSSDKATATQTANIEGGGTLKLDGLAPGATVVVASDGFQSTTLTAQ